MTWTVIGGFITRLIRAYSYTKSPGWRYQSPSSAYRSTDARLAVQDLMNRPKDLKTSILIGVKANVTRLLDM